MKRCTGPLNVESLHALLDYNQDTGGFVWKSSEGAKKAGAVAGSVKEHGYRLIRISGKFYYAHRLAWLWMTGEWPSKQVDHINRMRDDNRWCNLRPAENSENQWNATASRISKSGVRGVWRSADARWQAQVQKNGRRLCLGSFSTLEEAAKARRQAELKMYGEFAP